MSHTKKAAAPAATAESEQGTRPRRPFDGVMIALSAALLIIFGVVIGRFIVTARAVEVVDHFDVELATLRAELVELNRRLIQAEARESALEESSQRYRELATSQQIRADRLAARRQTVNTLISGLADQREACLSEIQQYVALDQPIPAMDVLQFADAVFDAQSAAFRQWNDDTTTANPTTADIPRLPGFPQAARPISTARHAAASRRPLDPPPSAQPMGASTATQEGVYFGPPHPQRQREPALYFCPQRSAQTLSFPGKPGVTFHDTAANELNDARR